ncbi:MAG: PepSY domain-containing protein [Parvularculaceae bacterium]|nr:PepSY domain-containing protein [Parvularculaceae bacterium]
MYIVAFSGCFALFHAELQTWEDPARRLVAADEPAPINDVFSRWIEESVGDEGEVGFVRISYPVATEPYYAGLLEVETHREDGGHDHEFFEQRWDTQTGAPIADRGHGFSHWLVDFHRELMWPEALGGSTVGRGLVGIAGVVLLLSIISGVVAHTKIFQELFTLRFFRSMRLKWQDTHKVLGLWGLPFYTMIALTGAVIGVVTLLAPIIAVLTFKGDQEALIEAVLGEPLEASGVPAQMLSLDDMVQFREPTSGNPVRFIVMNNWGDENARFDVYFEPDTELAQVEGYQINGVTGALITDSPFETLTAANRTLNAVTPLHYATYGGVVLKLVYLVLGLSLAVMTALGMMMWVERRLHGNEGKRSPWVYQALSKLTVGVTCGLPLATIAIVYADKLVPVEPGARVGMIGWTYFAAWMAGLVFAFVRGNDYRSAKELLTITAVLTIGLPLLNFGTSGDVFVTGLFAANPVSSWVDLSGLVFGLLMLVGVRVLPQARTEKQTRRTVTVPDKTSALLAAE